MTKCSQHKIYIVNLQTIILNSLRTETFTTYRQLVQNYTCSIVKVW